MIFLCKKRFSIIKIVMMRCQSKEELLFQLFSSELDAEDGKRILEILQFKGVLPQKEVGKAVTLVDFLEEFWDWERSAYIRERLLQSHRIHRRYVYRCAGAVRRYWLPWFGSRVLLQEISRQSLQDFILSFMNNDSLKSACGRNDVIKAGTIALRWAFSHGLIPEDITRGLRLYRGTPSEILILTSQMAELLFSRPWQHPKAMLANKLAMLTGMRAGEIQALRRWDIGEDFIQVNHGWNSMDGLKVPKNGCQRRVYLPFPGFLAELKSLASSDDGFVFSQRNRNQPMDAKCWLRELRRELMLLGFDPTLVQALRFHSWRHYYTTHLRASGQLPPHLIQRLTGHKSTAMLNHYSNHGLDQDAEEMKMAVSAVFCRMVGE